jgi:hypothetical protein
MPERCSGAVTVARLSNPAGLVILPRGKMGHRYLRTAPALCSSLDALQADTR